MFLAASWDQCPGNLVYLTRERAQKGKERQQHGGRPTLKSSATETCVPATPPAHGQRSPRGMAVFSEDVPELRSKRSWSDSQFLPTLSQACTGQTGRVTVVWKCPRRSRAVLPLCGQRLPCGRGPHKRVRFHPLCAAFPTAPFKKHYGAKGTETRVQSDWGLADGVFYFPPLRGRARVLFIAPCLQPWHRRAPGGVRGEGRACGAL